MSYCDIFVPVICFSQVEETNMTIGITAENLHNKKQNAKFLGKLSLLFLLAIFPLTSLWSTKMKDKVCEYIVLWVEDNLMTTKKIKDLEEVTGYSRSTLERWFRERYNLALGDYLYRRRMTRAAVLLRMTAFSITEIADHLHYYSSQNFSRAFLRFSGMTPTMYRKIKEWKCLTLIPSLYVNKNLFSCYQICKLPDLYIHGRYLNSTAFLSHTMHNIKIKDFLWQAITESGNKGVHVAGKVSIPLNRNKRGSNEVVVDLYSGSLVNKCSKHTIHITAGDYICWEFSCTFDEYYEYSKQAYMTLLRNTELKRRDGCDYIHFYPRAEGKDENEVAGALYIPVTLI